MERRHFLRLLALQAAAWSLGCGRHEGGAPGGASRASQGGPVSGGPSARDLPPNPFSGRWMGDDFTLGHRLRDGQLVPPAGGLREAATDVIVIGAGISGLTAAYQLAKAGRHVVVLEQASQIGGNAKSASWGGIDYSIGAAYLTKPDAGTTLETLYREIGVLDRAIKVPKGEALFDGRLVEGFWNGGTQKDQAVATTKGIADHFRDLYENRYPDIPWEKKPGGFSRAEFERLDRTPFARYLEERKAPPHVRMFCEYYCWSSFGGSAEEISTYAALNFITAEFGDVLALPGGNSGVARALADALRAEGVRIETDAIVSSVAHRSAGVEVAAFQGGAWHRYESKACVVATPRFIAARIIEGFPDDRRAIVAGMKWRAYVVANVLLSKRPSVEWYDAYRIEDLDPKEAGWTDLIVADFVASPKTPDRCVLTAYRALPYDGGRAQLLTDNDFPRHRDAVRRDLLPWLHALGLGEADIADINLARWGHPLVLAQPGQLAAGRLAALSRPFGRAVFAHQDRFGVPAIETAIEAGMRAVEDLRAGA